MILKAVELSGNLLSHLNRVDAALIDRQEGLRAPEGQPNGGEERIQQSSNQSRPDAMHVPQDDVKDAQRWSRAPDDEDVHGGEEDGPEEREREGQDGGREAIQPKAGKVEEQVRQPPDELEVVSRIRFSNDILEQDIDLLVDLALIAIVHVEPHGEVGRDGAWRANPRDDRLEGLALRGGGALDDRSAISIRFLSLGLVLELNGGLVL